MGDISSTKRFFIPYIGDKYEIGINGKKVLVLGASFYCLNKDCDFFADCTDYDKKDSSAYNYDCPSKDGDELTLEDILSTDPDELIDNVIDGMKNDIVKDALKSLTTREQRIILLRYGLDDDHRKTQEEVAQILGCTKSTVSNQERKALIKMRHPRNTRKLKNLIEE